MKANEPLPEFSLFGGPLKRLGSWLGLVRGSDTSRLGVALGLTAWGVLVTLALIQGAGRKVFSLEVLGVHVRFLVAVPLFFLCETWVGPRMAEFVREIVRSGIVPESGRPVLAADIRRVARIKDPWAAEIVLLLFVLCFAFVEPTAGLPGRTANWELLKAEAGGKAGAVLGWYFWVCLPLFRFLLCRWLWHLALWWAFLWRVQRLELHLIPTHPDHAAGLGYLEVVQEHFAVLATAFSAVLAASFAEAIASGSMAFEALYGLTPMVLLILAFLFVGPLFIFSSKLWACRVTGWKDYMGLAAGYVEGFNRKWLQGDNPTGEPLLGTPDLQSLADLTNSVTVVREMRWAPISRRLVLGLTAAALLPLLPLALFRYPFSELAAKVFQTITGL